MSFKAMMFLFLAATTTGAVASDETSSINAIPMVEGPVVCVTSPCPGPLAGAELIFVEDEMPVPLKTVIAERDVLAHHLDEDTGCGCIHPCLLAKKYKLKVDIEFEVA